jgi:hypothetical protein
MKRVDAEYEILTAMVVIFLIQRRVVRGQSTDIPKGHTYNLQFEQAKPLFATSFMLVSCLEYSFTLRTEVTMFLRNIIWLSTNYTALYIIRQNSRY